MGDLSNSQIAHIVVISIGSILFLIILVPLIIERYLGVIDRLKDRRKDKNNNKRYF